MSIEKNISRKSEEFTDDSLRFYIKKLLETLHDNNIEYIGKNTIKTYSKSLYKVLHHNRDIRIPIIQKTIDDMHEPKSSPIIQ